MVMENTTAAKTYCWVPRAWPPMVEVITEGILAMVEIIKNVCSFMGVRPAK